MNEDAVVLQLQYAKTAATPALITKSLRMA